jgi:ATP synthase protein I
MIFKNRDKKTWDMISRAALMGTNMVASTVVGLAMGYFLDKWLDTAPWMLITWLLLGIVAGFRSMYLETMKIYKSQAPDDEHRDA